MKNIEILFKKILKLFFDLFFKFKGKKKYSVSLQKTIDLYGDEDFRGLFAKIRAWDAPYQEAEKLIPNRGRIYDLGSGDGLFANYLSISSKNRIVTGIEIRKGRALDSHKGMSNTTFKVGNVLNENLINPTCVTMFHLLHHIAKTDDQERLIEKVSHSLKRGGKLVIVEICERPFYKYIFCYLVDAFVLPILFDQKLFDFDFHYRNIRDWESVLRRNGFTIKSEPIDKGMPFPHVIFEATKI